MWYIGTVHVVSRPWGNAGGAWAEMDLSWFGNKYGYHFETIDFIGHIV